VTRRWRMADTLPLFSTRELAVDIHTAGSHVLERRFSTLSKSARLGQVVLRARVFSTPYLLPT